MKYAKCEEDLSAGLAALYKSCGFKRYKPGCFEEYSFYQDNKDFLIGKNVITFSDLAGKLMAMRPDVTLSLIRHKDVEPDTTEKFYYDEKVYRQASGGKNFKEISQTGVEVVGVIDEAVEAEQTFLICKTLAAVDEDYVLEISHMGFTEGLLSEFSDDRAALSTCLQSKNAHDFINIANKRGYSDKLKNAFIATLNCQGDAVSALKTARSAALNEQMNCAVDELEKLFSVIENLGFDDKVRINFSASANAEYYNGIIFNGYLGGIPHCVLSGGRYDKLLRKYGKAGGAIGFALYIGEIERYLKKDDECVDYLVVYDDKTYADALAFMKKTTGGGQSVRLSGSVPKGVSYNKVIDLTKGDKYD